MMSRPAIRILVLLTVSLPLFSCAQAPKQMSYFVEDPLQFTEVLWPELPEVPRYRYAGQLLGEEHAVFALDSGAKEAGEGVGRRDSYRSRRRIHIEIEGH